MNNNKVLSRIQTIFNYDVAKVIEIFALAEVEVTSEQLAGWLNNETEASFIVLEDKHLAVFLDGFVIEKRGKKDGPQPVAAEDLTNNMIFKKLRIALDLKAEDILKVLAQAENNMSKHELSALFRREDHKNYRNCEDSVLSSFLAGLEKSQAS